MRWAIAFTSIVFSLLISEQVIRWVHPAPRVFRFLLGQKDSAYELSDDPLLGYQLKANTRSEHPDCHNTFDFTNSFGQRDSQRAIARTSGERRIIMLGDSVVAGHGICKLQDTLSKQLEGLYTGRAEVLNFGVGGYCTRAEIELLKTKGLQFGPDEVLLIFVDNDYVNSNGSIVNQIKSPRPALAEWAFRKSHIVRHLSLAFNLFGFADDFDPMKRLASNSAAIGDDNVATGFRILADLARENGFKARVFLWPRFTDDVIDQPWPLGTPPSDAEMPVEKLARDDGLEIYRLSGYFRKDFAERFPTQVEGHNPTPRWTYTIGDGTHPCELGAEIGARAIYAALQGPPPP